MKDNDKSVPQILFEVFGVGMSATAVICGLILAGLPTKAAIYIVIGTMGLAVGLRKP